MKIKFKTIVVTAAFACLSVVASAQFKMDSNGKTISAANGATIGKIDGDGKTVSTAGGATLGSVSSDGKTISNKGGNTVLRISGSTISSANGTTIAAMSDVTKTIQGSKPEAIYVALWWFIVKGNR
jgi:hypothetical protein